MGQRLRCCERGGENRTHILYKVTTLSRQSSSSSPLRSSSSSSSCCSRSLRHHFSVVAVVVTAAPSSSSSPMSKYYLLFRRCCGLGHTLVHRAELACWWDRRLSVGTTQAAQRQEADGGTVASQGNRTVVSRKLVKGGSRTEGRPRLDEKATRGGERRKQTHPEATTRRKLVRSGVRIKGIRS